MLVDVGGVDWKMLRRQKESLIRAISIVDVERRKLVNAVLLDDINLGAANPWGVACTRDGKYLCVAHAGTHLHKLVVEQRTVHLGDEVGTEAGIADQDDRIAVVAEAAKVFAFGVGKHGKRRAGSG